MLLCLLGDSLVSQASHASSLCGEAKPRVHGSIQAAGRLLPGLEKQQ